jgi:hypothetical protein
MIVPVARNFWRLVVINNENGTNRTGSWLTRCRHDIDNFVREDVRQGVNKTEPSLLK